MCECMVSSAGSVRILESMAVLPLLSLLSLSPVRWVAGRQMDSQLHSSESVGASTCRRAWVRLLVGWLVRMAASRCWMDVVLPSVLALRLARGWPGEGGAAGKGRLAAHVSTRVRASATRALDAT